jgi:hypothetical protein
MQRRILDALEPSKQICGRRYVPHAECLPDLCSGWLVSSRSPYLRAQLPPWVYDLELVRGVVVQQERATWPEDTLPPGKPFSEERAWWALSRYGKPNRRALGANIARALASLLARGELVACRIIPLVRYLPEPHIVGLSRNPYARWVVATSEEEATLYYPPERRVRFVTRPGEDKC